MSWEKVRLGDVTDSCLGKMLDQAKNKGEYQPYLANVDVRWGSFDLDTYTRFTTDRLSAILPDIPNAPSGWNTDNHYFYELMNRTGKDAHIQLAISSHNIPDDFRAICDKLNQFYPAKMGKEDWAYRIPFRTKSFALADELKETEIYAALDECMEEIIAFEQDLAEKMK